MKPDVHRSSSYLLSPVPSSSLSFPLYPPLSTTLNTGTLAHPLIFSPILLPRSLPSHPDFVIAAQPASSSVDDGRLRAAAFLFRGPGESGHVDGFQRRGNEDAGFGRMRGDVDRQFSARRRRRIHRRPRRPTSPPSTPAARVQRGHGRRGRGFPDARRHVGRRGARHVNSSARDVLPPPSRRRQRLPPRASPYSPSPPPPPPAAPGSPPPSSPSSPAAASYGAGEGDGAGADVRARFPTPRRQKWSPYYQSLRVAHRGRRLWRVRVISFSNS